jgi:ketosteroid isomerase-like protein
MDTSVQNEVMAVATEWDRSMIKNDADAIGSYMADDWTIVGSYGSASPSRHLKRSFHARS